MTSKGTKSTILKLKEALGKDYIKVQKYNAETDDQSLSSSFYERVLDIFRQLEELPIDLPLLTETLIGTTVSKFKACKQDQVSRAAKALIKKWKKTAKEAGMPSGSSSNKKTPKPIMSQSSMSSSKIKKENVARRNSSTPNKAATLKRPSITSAATASSKTPAAPEPEEWRELPQLRKNVCSKIRTVLSSSLSAMKEKKPSSAAIVKLSTEIESSVNEYARNDRQKYSEKARSLSFNLKKNTNLCVRIINGDIMPKNLVTMTPQQLATTEKAKHREDVARKTQDARRLDWEEQNEEKINEMCGIKGELLQASLFTCGRCKSIKTTSTQKQTRSADEPMTVFVLCLNCGNRWKC